MKRLFSTLQLNYVPKHIPVSQQDVELLKNFIETSRKLLVLTGAGISTESGIPDYRSEEVGLYARTNFKPIQYQEFMKSSAVKKRYWARNYVGWGRFSKCEPNITHKIIRDLELKHGKISVVITQNVDDLHGKAGSRNIIELHGSAHRVNCMNCDAKYSRAYIQKKLKKSNLKLQHTGHMVRPDGDVDIPQEVIDNFNPPFCEFCGGILKPDIVFFGENIPKQRVDKVKQLVTFSDSILILGTSLSVFSSYRILLQAVEENKNVCIVNIGPTKGEDKVDLKISAKCGDILPKIM